MIPRPPEILRISTLPYKCPVVPCCRSRSRSLVTTQLRSKCARLWLAARVLNGMLPKRGISGSHGHLEVRWCSAVTAQAALPTAAIVSVMPCRKGSVLDADRVRRSRSGEFPGGSKIANPLVICHCWKVSSDFQSAVVQVNSPILRKAAKAMQNAARRVAPSWVAVSSWVTRRSSRSLVIGSRSLVPVFRAAWNILIPCSMHCKRESSKADRSGIPRSMQ